MSETNLVIILPVYNGEDTIYNAINSVMTQKHINKRNFNVELIIVNDGSTDTTKEKIDSMRYDFRGKIFHLEDNFGAYYARNYALDHIRKADYICFLDSDDQFSNQYSLYKMYRQSRYHENLIVGNLNIINNIDLEESEVKLGKFKDLTVYNQNLIGLPITALPIIPFFHRCWFKYDIIKENLIRFKNYKLGEDIEFYANYLQYVERFTAVNVDYYDYNNIENKEYNITTLEQLESLEKLYSFYKKKSFSLEHLDHLKNVCNDLRKRMTL
ncbi:MAG: glycosyltransferase family 2 protein [Methanobrevibacter sp.]|jgi:glycosyltransferase involved in cell wall biosynthesis|nr:glycosyltransferase family 2 protein [Candidatus Methanovirga aequatorialis]